MLHYAAIDMLKGSSNCKKEKIKKFAFSLVHRTSMFICAVPRLMKIAKSRISVNSPNLSNACLEGADIQETALSI